MFLADCTFKHNGPAACRGQKLAACQAGTLCSLSLTKALLLAFHVPLFSPHKATLSLKRGLTLQADAGSESIRGPEQSQRIGRVLSALQHPVSIPRLWAQPQAACPRGLRDRNRPRGRLHLLTALLPHGGSPFPLKTSFNQCLKSVW